MISLLPSTLYYIRQNGKKIIEMGIAEVKKTYRMILQWNIFNIYLNRLLIIEST